VSFEPNVQTIIGGKTIAGGLPTNNQILRFNAATNQWEFVESTGMSALEYLINREQANKLFTARGQNTVGGVLCSITPSNGVTHHIVSGKASMKGDAAGDVTLSLRIDGVTVEEFELTTAVGSTSAHDEFKIAIGKELAGDGVKTIDINLTVGAGAQQVEAELATVDPS